jgi:hypothetical protein
MVRSLDIKATRVFYSAPARHQPQPDADTRRRNIYVKPLGPESWEAISAVASNRFASRESALAWARSTAQREFLSTGLPWGVKVWAPLGGWVYDTCHGQAADDNDA